MWMFSFEVDSLEIHLREVLGLVDVVFLVEATVTNQGKPKPLLWERVKNSQRFGFLREEGVMTRVVHLVVDDRMAGKKSSEVIWHAENRQTRLGVQGVKDWMHGKVEFNGTDDIFISGDVDEVLSRQALHQLRWCNLRSDLSTGALWMPMGDLTRAHKTDFPVQGRPHTFGLPTVYKLQGLLRGEVQGSRLMTKYPGNRSEYVLGGVHLTNTAFIPTSILKELTATEKFIYSGHINIAYLLILSPQQLDKEQERLYRMEDKTCFLQNMDRLEEATDVEHYIPWFLDCNKQRFPYWYDRPDPRNLALYTALRENPKMQALRRGMGDPPQSCKVKGFCNSEPTFKRLFGKDFTPVPNSTGSFLACGVSVFFKRK